MQYPVENLQRIKFVVHCVQAVIAATTWVLTLGVLVSAGVGSAPSNWYFAVVSDAVSQGNPAN
jgi:hypothetical protein